MIKNLRDIAIVETFLLFYTFICKNEDDMDRQGVNVKVSKNLHQKLLKT